MKMLTKEIENKIPALYAQDGKGENATVYVKFFNPCGAATWYGTEYDPIERIFFGWATLDGQFGELGYFSLTELENITLPYGLKIERDLHFKPCTIKEVKENHL